MILQKTRHNKLAMRDMVKLLRQEFANFHDPRAANTVYPLEDVLISAFALFVFKYPSLLCFEQKSRFVAPNLKRLFRLQNLCSDSQMRRIIDEVDPKAILRCFPKSFEVLEQLKMLRAFLYFKEHFLISIDGVHFFHSNKIHCDRCSVTHHQCGDISFSHSMLAAVLVHPEQKEVFPLAAEAIQKQDGATKNDCELNAAKRLTQALTQQYPGLSPIILEDALFANEPHLKQLIDNGWHFITSVKPTKHQHLFKMLETRKKHGKTKHWTFDDGHMIHRFWWSNDLPLNQNGTLRVNFLHYEQQDRKGKITKFSWITSFVLRKDNVFKIMRAGRSRWKIENEAFNTLKNQGYHFDHNFGHGYNQLCNNMALLMLLAFLVDQMIQACSKNFRDICSAARAKYRVWEAMRAFFMTTPLQSFDDLMIKIAYMYQVKLE